MHRQPERCGTRRSRHGKHLESELAHLAGTVHQIRKIGRGERLLVGAGEQLRRHAPRGSGRALEADGRAPLLEAAYPHQRCRHVDVGVVGIDAQIRAVRSVAEHAIVDADGVRVRCDVPTIGIGAGHRQRAAALVGDPDIQHVLRELVKRVSPRRRSAHAQVHRDRRAHLETSPPRPSADERDP